MITKQWEQIMYWHILGSLKFAESNWWKFNIEKTLNCSNKLYQSKKRVYKELFWDHTAVHGLYFSKNQGMIGRRIFWEAICSMHIGQIFSTAWFNHLTVSESVRTWSGREITFDLKQNETILLKNKEAKKKKKGVTPSILQ